jgi:lipopolysaccharide transport system ATP-binding protein
MRSIITVENLSKEYRLGTRNAAYGTLRDSIVRGFRAPFKRFQSPEKNGMETIWALKDVSFAVKPGEVVGIIGRNGAGKSTLLKILSRIVEPTTGNVKLYGRVGSLLEVGTGFHPELSGRENIYLNGAILGMKRAEIEAKFDEIVAFAEIEKFIDTAVKHYSSGMYMRLAFAVAAHLEPEILIVDEVLAVGDAVFQKKCLGKMGDVAREGRTVLFVSHNIPAVLGLCQRAILLDAGQVVVDEEAKKGVDRYLQEMQKVSRTPLAQRTDRQGNQRIKFVEFGLRDAAGAQIPHAYSGQDIALAFKYEAPTNVPLKDIHIDISVHGGSYENLFWLSTAFNSQELGSASAKGELLCSIPRLPLQEGQYAFNLFCTVSGDTADWIQSAGVIEVRAGDFFGVGKLPPASHGAFIVQHSWNLSPA